MTELPLLTTCDGCGACCRHMIVPPFILAGGRNEAEEKGVPADLLAELLPRWELRFFVAESPCLWYDAATARCRHYDLRPDACRAFEINSPHCRASREKWSDHQPHSAGAASAVGQWTALASMPDSARADSTPRGSLELSQRAGSCHPGA